AAVGAGVDEPRGLPGPAGVDRPSGVPTAGGEPIEPATARRLAAEATAWERLFLNPDTGVLLTVDHYTPTAAQRRFLRARDEHCRFPGCRQAARRCDADHIHPHSRGGPTDVTNLETLCKRHHMLKHHSPWQVRHLGGGELEWTSPLGHHYTGRPTSGVRFVETALPGDGSAQPGDGSAAASVAGGAPDPAPF
ncbi:HNH endonuclease signature motif containing protein, partial [Microbacterium sp. NPDC003461]